jgi:hypothetical protein
MRRWIAGFAFAQLDFPGKDVVFILVLLQLFILPEVLIVENYAMISRLGLFDTILGVGMPYMASAFGILPPGHPVTWCMTGPTDFAAPPFPLSPMCRFFRSRCEFSSRCSFNPSLRS